MRGKCPKCGTELIATEKTIPLPQAAWDAAWTQFDRAFKAFDKVFEEIRK